MSKDDKDDGYEPVVGFSVPLKRVLGHDERPENPDGSRTGSLFMTLEGCTFEHDGVQGSAAATVGAPTVVVEVIDGKRDYLTKSRSSSRFIVDAHDIVQVAVNAHKARMSRTGSDPNDKPDDPSMDKVLRRLTRLVWIMVGKAQNPLLHQVMSCSQSDRLLKESAAWSATQVELGRAMFRIVFHDEPPDLALINRALDFVGS